MAQAPTGPIHAVGLMDYAANHAPQIYKQRESMANNTRALGKTVIQLFPNLNVRNANIDIGSPLFLDAQARSNGTELSHPPVFQYFNGAYVPISEMAGSSVGWSGASDLTKPADMNRLKLEGMQHFEDSLVYLGVANTNSDFTVSQTDNGGENPPSVQIAGVFQFPAYVDIPVGALLIWRVPRNLSGLPSNLIRSAEGERSIEMEGTRRTKVMAEIVPWDPTECHVTRDWMRRYLGFDKMATMQTHSTHEFNQLTKAPNAFVDSFVDLIKNVLWMGEAVRLAHVGNGGVMLDAKTKMFGLEALTDTERNEPRLKLSKAAATALKHPKLEGVPYIVAVVFLALGVEDDAFIPLPLGGPVPMKAVRDLQTNAATRSLIAYQTHVYKYQKRFVGTATRGGLRGHWAEGKLGNYS